MEIEHKTPTPLKFNVESAWKGRRGANVRGVGGGGEGGEGKDCAEVLQKGEEEDK